MRRDLVLLQAFAPKTDAVFGIDISLMQVRMWAELSYPIAPLTSLPFDSLCGVLFSTVFDVFRRVQCESGISQDQWNW
jgi:hypothetical protein